MAKGGVIGINNIPNRVFTSGVWKLPEVYDAKLNRTWAEAYAYSKTITIDSSKVSSNLTNYPVMVELTDTNFDFSDIQDTNGYDLVFLDDNGVTLKHETELYDSANELAVYHVKIPTVSSSADTTFQMLYGNSNIDTDQSDAQNVWDDDFIGVWHMQDTTAVEDSTGNEYDLTNGSSTVVDGIVAKARSFNGTSTYAKTTTNIVSTATALTIQGLIKGDGNNSTYQCALHRSATGTTTIGTSCYWFGFTTGFATICSTIGANDGATWSAGNTTIVPTIGTWYSVGTRWNGTTAYTYVDGTQEVSYSLSSVGFGTSPTRFGSSADGTSYQYNGDMDEIRISKVDRGDAWMKADDYNLRLNTLISLS